MSVTAQPRTWQRRTPRAQLLTWAAWLAATAICVVCFQFISDKTIWAFVTDAPAQAADLAVRMVPPDWGYIRQLGRPIWDTINIATLGTVMAIILAVPVAYCAARNTTPSVAFVRPLALFIIVSSRSINSLIWALMLVTIIGPGVLAGIFAIGLRSIGFVAKLLYEAIEEIDEGQVEAVRATGASFANLLTFGVVPQVLSRFIGFALYQLDSNLRNSTMVGIVGAGGVGGTLFAAFKRFDYDFVAAILLSIIALIMLGELFSARLRRTFQ